MPKLVTTRPSSRAQAGTPGRLLPEDQEKGTWLIFALPLGVAFWLVVLVVGGAKLVGALS